MSERLHHEGRADEQNESEGYFHNDERIAKSRSAGDASRGSFFQGVAWSHARRARPFRGFCPSFAPSTDSSSWRKRSEGRRWLLRAERGNFAAHRGRDSPGAALRKVCIPCREPDLISRSAARW